MKLKLLQPVLITQFILICLSYQAQLMTPAVAQFIKYHNLQPLNQVDTAIAGYPGNITTPGGWEIKYFGKKTITNVTTFDVYRCIYKDSVYHIQCAIPNPFKLQFDSLEFVKETADFIYFKKPGNALEDNLTAFSKTKNNFYYQLNYLANKDFENEIFIEDIGPVRRTSTNSPHFKITNLKTGRSQEAEFKNTCNGGKNFWCIDRIIYKNGRLQISATLFDKKKQRNIKETIDVGM